MQRPPSDGVWLSNNGFKMPSGQDPCCLVHGCLGHLQLVHWLAEGPLHDLQLAEQGWHVRFASA